jgi:caffeoyl-CoA O-methyltransferase
MYVIDDDIEIYATEHSTRQDPILKTVEEATVSELEFPTMMVGHLEGMFLEMLIFALRPKKVLEIGTFSGYSSIAMAQALDSEATIDSLDINPRHIEFAKRHIKMAKLENVITIHEGDAKQTLTKLDGPFDFIFIDADKSGYDTYLEMCLPKLSDRGLIAVDNTLWSKNVLNDDDQSEDTVALRSFNKKVAENTNLRVVVTTIRDGVTLIRKNIKN